MIYTSYFGKMKDLPSNVIPVAICGGIPDWYTGAWYKKPAPKWKFFQEWKQNHDNNFYIEHYNAEVLDTLDYSKVLVDLQVKIPENIRAEMQEPVWRDPNHHIALLCYEKPGDFCHRHLFAEWLSNKADIEIKEYSDLV